MKKKKNVVNAEIEGFINEMLSQVKTDTTASLTDKMKVLDRALKWEAIKLKAEDDAWGSGFMQDSEEDS
jgi:hypothetical protein